MEPKTPALTQQEIDKRVVETELLANDMERHIERLGTELEAAVKRHSYFTRQLKRLVYHWQTAQSLGQVKRTALLAENRAGALEAYTKATADLKAAYDRYFASI